MKRFFNFLLFVVLLTLAVGSLQLWKDRRLGIHRRWEEPFVRLFGDTSNAGQRTPEKYTLADGPRINLKDVDVLAAMSQQRILLARAVVPSVVSIVTSKTVQVPDYLQNPFYEYYRRNQRQENRGTHSRVANQLGSGAIVSKEGHIVTNNHVIAGMDEIAVKLSDGRESSARLIGTDPDTDIAVLKIDAENLTPLPIGNSEIVEVGETVMAVGNPYGYEESVTQGIISAKNRRGDNASDLFQIDAAINPGNSGGPLINVRGELIGINEAIFSRSGSWAGVGFAIPSATVKRVVDGILKAGRVIHGYLGVNVARADGPALVDSVTIGSPADKASIRSGDVIRKFNGKTITDFDELRQGVAAAGIDSKVPVELERDGKTVSVNATIAERPPEDARLARVPHLPPGHPPIGPGGGSNVSPPSNGDNGDRAVGLLGAVTVRDLADGDLRKLKLPDNVKGVLVTEVNANTPAAEKLESGDIIESINSEPVTSLKDYARLVRGLPPDQMVVLSIFHDRNRTVAVINPE